MLSNVKETPAGHPAPTPPFTKSQEQKITAFRDKLFFIGHLAALIAAAAETEGEAPPTASIAEIGRFIIYETDNLTDEAVLLCRNFAA